MTRTGAMARVAGVLALLGAALLAGACSEKIVDVDPAAFPEGVASPSQLVMYRDAGSFIYVYEDTLPIGPSTRDQLVDIVTHYQKAPNVALGMVFDFTDADRYEIHRREAGGGFSRLKDFLLRPTRLWLDSQSEIYQFDDAGVGAASRDYLGRGVVDGTVTPLSPLTNVATLAMGAPTGNQIQMITDTLRIRRDPADSTRGNIRSVEWSAVPGAAGYWLHIYQSTEQTNFGLFARGFPSPVFAGRARDHLVAWIPLGTGPTVRYQSGLPAPDERVLMDRPIIYLQQYEVHITAVDAQGRLIAVIQFDPRTRPTASGPGLSGAIRGDALTQLAGQEYPETFYGVYPMGSYVLSSENPPLPGTGAPFYTRHDVPDQAATGWNSARR
jgi:hypothetical protein